MMIASLLSLSRADMKILRFEDSYSTHRIVYDLFDDLRSNEEKSSSVSSGLLYVDRGGSADKREILILSDRMPRALKAGSIQSKAVDDTFLSHTHYRFEVVINPTKRESKTGRLVALRSREAISHWFVEKASSWGFQVVLDTLCIEKIWIQQFDKAQHKVTQACAKLTGELTVLDRQSFINSFKKGIGRGRAFGCGLLQVIPLTK